jgi:hypothetical protein
MHLVIIEHRIASKYLAVHDRQMLVCLTKQIIQKENILFMFYHIHGTFKLQNIQFLTYI